MKKGVDINRVVKKIVYTILSLWIGGFIIQIVADTMLGYCSPFFQGFSLFGWQVGTYNATAVTGAVTVDAACVSSKSNYVLYDVSNAGILIIVGIVGVASVIMEFVNFSW